MKSKSGDHTSSDFFVSSPEALLERVILDFDYANMIEVDGVSAGLFKVKFREALNQWYVVQIQVHPDFQNMQIGSKLILELFERAKTIHSSVALGVLKTNPAQNLYYKLGFKKVGALQLTHNSIHQLKGIKWFFQTSY